MTDVRQFIMEARGSSKKKGKGGDAAKRGRFLRVVMRHLSSDRGKSMANAVEAKDLEQFKTLWNQATSAILSDLEAKFKQGKDNAEVAKQPNQEAAKKVS